jgi:predicted nucleic acid-binding protein
MKALLDTNIVIHREAAVIVHGNIGALFSWLDKLGYEKCIHPLTVAEIRKHKDERVRNSFLAKMASYRELKAPASIQSAIQTLSDAQDQTESDRNDTRILNELYAARVDILITEDRALAKKAGVLGLGDRVFTIDSFLEKAIAEHPELVDYNVLSVKKTLVGRVDVSVPFFESFREEYPNFDRWFNGKSEEPAYVCYDGQRLVAYLFLKLEDTHELYSNIEPAFAPKRRLKIGTMKVALNGYKIGERFLKIIFDNAIRQRVDEIYVTIFPRSVEQVRLIQLLEDFGFRRHGQKNNEYGAEEVYTRDMTPHFKPDEPRLSFPFVSRNSPAYLLPIYPRYHTELLPDSILKTESPEDYQEHSPHRNSIRKVYISRSIFRAVKPGDTIIFYRTGGHYKSVVTTLGIVEAVHDRIETEAQFIRMCRKRSVFSDDELREHWNYKGGNRPFIVDFLYAYSFPRRPNMASLISRGVIRDIQSAPRGFERISNAQFDTILELSETDPRVIVN